MVHVRDGSSKTYPIGEKYLNPDSYDSGWSGADNENLYGGFDNDHYQTTNPDVGQPMRDRPGLGNGMIFDSGHAGGFQVAMCDGSVTLMKYNIDAEVHRRLGNRKDGQPVGAQRQPGNWYRPGRNKPEPTRPAG